MSETIRQPDDAETPKKPAIRSNRKTQRERQAEVGAARKEESLQNENDAREADAIRASLQAGSQSASSDAEASKEPAHAFQVGQYVAWKGDSSRASVRIESIDLEKQTADIQPYNIYGQPGALRKNVSLSNFVGYGKTDLSNPYGNTFGMTIQGS